MKKEFKVTRKWLDRNFRSQRAWGKLGSDEREVMYILVTSAFIGAFPKKIKEVLGDPNKLLLKVTRNARKNEIWHKDGTVYGDWGNEKTGVTNLVLDVSVCQGLLKRSDNVCEK